MARRAREVRRFRDELLDELLAGADPAEVFTDGGLLDDPKEAVAERALDAEMDAHLEGERSGGNHRNGHNRKRVLTDEGALELAAPRPAWWMPRNALPHRLIPPDRAAYNPRTGCRPADGRHELDR